MQKKTAASQIIISSTNRHNGASSIPFYSLNLSYGVGDTPKSILENRTHLKNNLSIANLLSAKQVHGDNIFIAETPLN
ncbi:MAG: laccase domain-containing protein, partial [Desulfocapsa sp.]|nr:laccase domain-containing protein [Desulfocapsa sp.]